MLTAHRAGRVIAQDDLTVFGSRDTAKPSLSLGLDTPDARFLRDGGDRTSTFEPGQHKHIVRYETVDDAGDDGGIR